jgi:hypothetical protein
VPHVPQRGGRLGGACGVLYVVFLALGEALPEEAGIRVELVGLVLFLPFAAYLATVLRRDHSVRWLAVTALAAAVANTAVKVASAAPFVVARGEPEGSELRRALVEVNDASFILTMLPLSVMTAAVALAVLWGRALPAWIGWTAAVTAVALLLNGMLVDAEFGPAFLLFLLWSLAVAVYLTARPERRDRPATP